MKYDYAVKLEQKGCEKFKFNFLVTSIKTRLLDLAFLFPLSCWLETGRGMILETVKCSRTWLLTSALFCAKETSNLFKRFH
jgi:hypothetical protein